MERKTMAIVNCLKPKAPPAPWTGARIARVRRSIREAFSLAHSMIPGESHPDDIEDDRKRLAEGLKEVQALVAEFARQNGLK